MTFPAPRGAVPAAAGAGGCAGAWSPERSPGSVAVAGQEPPRESPHRGEECSEVGLQRDLQASQPAGRFQTHVDALSPGSPHHAPRAHCRLSERRHVGRGGTGSNLTRMVSKAGRPEQTGVSGPIRWPRPSSARVNRHGREAGWPGSGGAARCP